MVQVSRRTVTLALVCAPLSAVAPMTAVADPQAQRGVRTISARIPLGVPRPLDPRWMRLQSLGYGAAPSELGTSEGGEGLFWGPGYGVQVPDTSWWYADAAKRRLAHYGDSGEFLGQAELPGEHLPQGYFQWANPMALADGTVVLTSTTIDSAALLLHSPSQGFRRVELARPMNIVVGDGVFLYGFDDENRRVRLDPETGDIRESPAFGGQGGRLFIIDVDDAITVTRPGVKVRLELFSRDYPGATVHPQLEAVMGADGRLWILLTGIVEVSAGIIRTVVGLIWIHDRGQMSPVYRVRVPTSASDPGDGHHLGIRHGDSRPTLMFVDATAVRVYRRG
ncbi:MAG TPA: hypothetical protein PKE40_00440 [Arachnia sp.]|nr:hypothetical protein [Arachnia sp.]HMT84793.1 hypothetical protein [Arachnia sp.]